MVTKKTRVLSVVAVVLMLVSMFTCFVLPATAATPTSYAELPEGPMPWPDVDLVPFARHKTSTYKSMDVTDDAGITHYAITDADDWLAAVAWSNGLNYTSSFSSVTLARTKNTADTTVYRQTFENTVLWLTNDIDFSAFNGTITATNDKYDELFLCARGNNSVSGAFRGSLYGQGYSFKNFDINFTYQMANGNYDNLAIIGAGNGCTVRDLTIDASCSFTYRMSILPTSDSALGAEHYTGVFMALGAGPCTFINCRNYASLDFYDLNDGKVICQYIDTKKDIDYTGQLIPNKSNSISVFGRHANGVTLINCFNAGNITNNDTARAVALAEWMSMKKSNTIINCFNIGQLSTASPYEYYLGLFSRNNDEPPTVPFISQNCYSVGYDVGAASSEANAIYMDAYGTKLDADAAATGELAYLLNKGYVPYDGVDRVYYTVKNGVHVVGTAAEQPVKLNIALGAFAETIYAVATAEGTIDLNAVYPLVGGVYKVEDEEVLNGILTVVPGSEVDIVATSTAKVYDYLQEKLTWFATETLAYYKDADGNVLTQAVLDGIQEKVTADSYADQAAIDVDLALLEGYTLDTSIIAVITDYAKYPNQEGYAISTKAEMEYVAELLYDLTVDQTLYILDDIDMGGTEETPNKRLPALKASINGGGNTISGLYLTDSWLGNFAGKKIENLIIANSAVSGPNGDSGFLITRPAYSGVELKNITFDGVSLTSTVDSSVGGQQGILFSTESGKVVNISNVIIRNSIMNRPAEKADKYWNSGLLFGKTYKGTVNAEKVVIENNKITGQRYSSGGIGLAIGELICHVDIKDMLVRNNTVKDGYTTGILGMVKTQSSGETNPLMNFENIVAYNNVQNVNGNEVFMKNSADIADFAASITVKNVYVDEDVITVTTVEEIPGLNVGDSAVANAGEEIASGEAAWALNAALAGDKWTMVDGKPVFGTEDNQTVRIQLDMDGFDPEYIYCNWTETATLAHTVPGAVFVKKNAEDTFFTINGEKLTFSDIPANDELTAYVVAGSDSLYFDELDAKIAEIGDKGAFYLNAEGTETVETVLATIVGKRESGYSNNKQIRDDYLLLDSYVLTEVDAENLTVITDLRDDLVGMGALIDYYNSADAIKALIPTLNAALADVEAANGIEAKEINATLADAVIAFNAIDDWTADATAKIPGKYFARFAGHKTWTVADEADWRALAAGINANAMSEGMIITLINDIDMAADGDNSSVNPFAYGKYFNGTLDGQGHVFKNLKIEVSDVGMAEGNSWVGLVSALGATGIVKNLGIESGSIELTHGTSHAARVGSIVGYGTGGSVIQNCWNAASVTMKRLEAGRADSYVGGIVGSGIANSTVDGCYNIGAVYSEGAHAAGINGWAQGGGATASHGRVYNSFNAGSVTAVVNPTYVGAVRPGGNNLGGFVNTYAIGTKLVFIADTDEKIEANNAYKEALSQNTAENSNLSAEIYATGELAWKLNSGYVEGYSNHVNYPDVDAEKYPNFANYQEIRPYYTVEDGKTVLGTEENQTVRVTIKHDGMENVIYVNADEYYDLGETGTYVLESGAAEVIDSRYLKIDSAGDIVVTVTVPESGIITHAHADHLAYTNNEDGTHTAECGYFAFIDNRMFDCDYAEETTACTEFTYAVDRATINAETHAHQSVATCTACGYSAPAADCVAGFEEAVTGTPDCVNPGEKTFTCKGNCGYSYTELIPENGHKEIYAPAGNNQHTVTCENCQILNKVENCTPDENGWNETFAPSVNEFGTKETTCTVCGGTVTEQIAKLTAAMITAGINATETEVTGTVALLNNPGVDSVTVKVAFDYTIMDLKDVVAENGLTVGTPSVENGVVTFTVTGEIEGDLNIAVVTFTMKTENGNLVASNRDYELKVTATADATELEGSEDTFTVTLGNDVVKGDMTGDKVVDLSDAILLIRYVSGTELPEGYAGTITDAMADLTDEGDGADLGEGQIAPEVNINDVLYLLRYLNGWTNVL